MTFDEFKKTCYHTENTLRIPLLNTSLDKKLLVNLKGKYDFKREEQRLRKIFDNSNLKDK